MKVLYFLLATICLIGCQSSVQSNTDDSLSEQKEIYQKPEHHSENITQVFNAHGGYQLWKEMKSLSYKKGDETTITDLQNRKIRLESSKQTIGFDGTQVWVTPDSVDVGRHGSIIICISIFMRCLSLWVIPECLMKIWSREN